MLNRKLITCIGLLLVLSHCDTKKRYEDNIANSMFCHSFAICNGQTPARVGIIGDSWTDYALGLEIVETLRTRLENDHGYQFAGATLGGRTLSAAVGQGLQFQVIDEAGADIKTIIISLGGNDLQANIAEFVGNVDAVQASRFAKIRTDLKHMVQTGNAYKLSKFGGQPITWIIHGYDYPNPYMNVVRGNSGCKTLFDQVGLNVPDAAIFARDQLDGLNNTFLSIANEEPTLLYVDLRRTLFGPPSSQAEFMTDCIHPNNLGYKLLADRFALTIYPITNIGR
ncbi:SGNH/GDSL hydrolase family protein [Leptospira sp. 96542]|nr:SGNH/GDSL hydrolase family protein [Leptospira sp. 96542]